MHLTRVNLALAAVVALLALVLLFGPDPVQEGVPESLTGLDPEAIRHIRIHRATEGVIELRRSTDGWHMTAPFRLSADRQRLQALVHIASTPSQRSFPVDQADLAELGLAPAPLILELEGLTLEIGGTEPIRRRRYIRVGNRVHLIDDRFQHHLLSTAAAFVDRRPFPAPIQSATLDGSPLGTDALHVLGRVQARNVESGEPPPDARRLEIGVDEGGSPLAFRLGSRGERLWREQPPLLYRLEPPISPELLGN